MPQTTNRAQQSTYTKLNRVVLSWFAAKQKKSYEIITSNQVKYIGKMGIKFKTINIFLNINNLLLWNGNSTYVSGLNQSEKEFSKFA